MTLSDALLIEQNPWWSQPDAWEGHDPHLRRLAAQPVELPSLVADSIPLAEPAVHVTISIGVAAFPESAVDSDGVLGAADAALLLAKSQGRDRVCLVIEG